MARSSPSACDEGLVPYDGNAVRAWLQEQGYEEGDLWGKRWGKFCARTPIGHACSMGELYVCKWVHDHDAAADIHKTDFSGTTSMYIACQEGHLSVCKWLFEVGAAADITKANNNGATPM